MTASNSTSKPPAMTSPGPQPVAWAPSDFASRQARREVGLAIPEPLVLIAAGAVILGLALLARRRPV